MGDLWLHFYCLAQVYHLESFPFAYTLYILRVTSRYYPEFGLCIAFYCTFCCVLGICKLVWKSPADQGGHELLPPFTEGLVSLPAFLYLFVRPELWFSIVYHLLYMQKLRSKEENNFVLGHPAQVSRFEIQTRVCLIPKHSATPPLILGSSKGNELNLTGFHF